MNEQDLLALLDTLHIPFQRIEHPALRSVEDFYRLGIELPDQGVKNLFLKSRKGDRYYLLILDERKTADLSTLAGQIGETRLSFASAERLRELLGVEPGAVTPFGLLHDTDQRVQVLLDESVRFDQVLGFHPLVSTATVCISYPDLMRFFEYCSHTPKVVNSK